MRSFASAFILPSGGNFWNNTSALSTKSQWSSKLMSSGVIVDAKNTEHIQNLLDGRKLNYTIHNDIKSELIPSATIMNGDTNMQPIGVTLGETSTKKQKFENAFHFSQSILNQFNDYNFVFSHELQEIYGKGLLDSDNTSNEAVGKKVGAVTVSMAHVPSLFNPQKSINVIGVTRNIPLYNDVKSYKPLSTSVITERINDGGVDDSQRKTTLGDHIEADWTDCSIKKLVELSNKFNDEGISALGQERFKYADFMFCKDLGRISNNYLITLRRFASPIGDDIMCKNPSNRVAPDIGRMICYIGEDNKLDDILKYQYNTSWKELNAKIQEKSSEEDSQDRSIIGSIVNLSNPTYLKGVLQGKNGSGNSLLNWASHETVLGSVMDNKGTYEGHEIWGNYDNNRVYEPHDTVQDTHIYEGKLKFTHEFTLTFNYEMRAYDNINPRAAFMDLLANVQVVTYREGSFWGGQRQLNGASSNPAGWAKANAFIDKAWDKLGGFCEGLLTGNVDWQSVWGSISNAFGAAGQMLNEAKEIATDPNKRAETGQKIVNKWKSSGMGDAFKGMLKNKLGRPAMYAWDSLLKGDPVGFHHVTIGNPRSPILSIGNLIITNTSVQHYGPLGIDDFPTGLKVTVNLKHAKSRDAIEIQQMYTGGTGILSAGFSGMNKIEDYYALGPKVDTGDPNKNVYYAANGNGSDLKMVHEERGWVLYESTPKFDNDGNFIQQVQSETVIGNTSDPSKSYNTAMASKNAKLKSQGMPSLGDATKTKEGFGTVDGPQTVVERFGTNNIDQIVANSAIFARKV